MDMDVRQKCAMLEVLAHEQVFDAMIAHRLLREERDVNIDWHRTADYLDELNSKKLIRPVGCNRDGFVKYTWNN